MNKLPDTLAMYKEMLAVGFTAQQAEAFVRVLYPVPEAARIQRLKARVAELERWQNATESGAAAMVTREPVT